MAKKAFDAEAFREFEYLGWDRLHSGYRKQWAHLTTQVAPALLDGAGVDADTDVLDVACGPAYVAAAANARGARLAFTAWAESDDSAIAIGMAAITQHGRLDVDLPAGTPLFRFADSAECARTLVDKGFRDVVSRGHELVWRLPRPFALMEVFREATARLSGLLGAQDPEALPKISGAMTAGCQRFVDGELALLPMPCVLTAARKP